ncbi:hypothetical protein B0H12DRAFT_1109894 [Mycena haematopus]|nr:hypothetical protein B0H12DRAFT_1109894 [Mycena haematopus]
MNGSSSGHSSSSSSSSSSPSSRPSISSSGASLSSFGASMSSLRISLSFSFASRKLLASPGHFSSSQTQYDFTTRSSLTTSRTCSYGTLAYASGIVQNVWIPARRNSTSVCGTVTALSTTAWLIGDAARVSPMLSSRKRMCLKAGMLCHVASSNSATVR